MREILREQGIKAPERSVVVIPPANAWRHLAKVDASFHLEPCKIPSYGLWCHKPVLNDAPVAWQLSLGLFLKEQKGHHSHLDDSFFFGKEPTVDPPIKAVLTTHVDDLAVVGKAYFLDELYGAMTKRFGKISRDKLPFVHSGSRYSQTSTGLKIDRADFASRLKPADNPPGAEDRKLKPQEVTQFRSVLGGLLWLCSTRLGHHC